MYKITIPSELLEMHLHKFGQKIHDKINELYLYKIRKGADDECYLRLFVEHTQLDDSNNLLVASPPVLSGFIEKYKDLEGKVSEDIVAEIKSIFSYNKFSRSARREDDWCAARYLQELGVHACCYCNADVVYSKKLRKDKKAIYHSPLDHFYSQKEYPYLALSLYNLVPACDRCNSKFKHEKDVMEEKLLNPYQESLHDYFQFQVVLNDVRDFLYWRYGSKVRPKMTHANTQAENSLSFFRIEDVYNKIYSFVIRDIVTKNFIYESGYGEWLGGFLEEARNQRVVGQFKELTPNQKTTLEECLCQLSRQDWKRLLFGFSFVPEEINQRPFAKLILDLARD